MQQHNTWGKDRDLLAEAVGKVFSEQHDPELEDLARDAMAPDPMEDPTREVEDGETVGDFDQFIEKAEKFVDAIGDSELEFLMNLGKHQFEILMQVVKDEHGYRSAPK